MQQAKRTRTLWRMGIPPNVRRQVWIQAVHRKVATPDQATDFDEIMVNVTTDRAIRAVSGAVSENARLVSVANSLFICFDYIDIPRCAKVVVIFISFIITISNSISRTYPSLEMFQKDCSLNQPLQYLMI